MPAGSESDPRTERKPECFQKDRDRENQLAFAIDLAGRKSERACPLIAFCGAYRISNSISQTAYLTQFPDSADLVMMYFMGSIFLFFPSSTLRACCWVTSRFDFLLL